MGQTECNQEWLMAGKPQSLYTIEPGLIEKELASQNEDGEA